MDATNFKTYDELKEKLNRVISGTPRNTETVSDVDLPPAYTTSVKSEDVSASVASTATSTNVKVPELDDDDTMSYFSKLADED